MQHNNTSTSAVLSSKLEKNLTPKKLDMGLKLYKMLFGFRVSKLNKRENDHLIEFHLTFSVDQKFLIIWAFDQILFWRLIESFNN